MIEIYLATLLFGLGTMYNKAQNKPQLKQQNSNVEQDTNPYNQQLIKKVKKIITCFICMKIGITAVIESHN